MNFVDYSVLHLFEGELNEKIAIDKSIPEVEKENGLVEYTLAEPNDEYKLKCHLKEGIIDGLANLYDSSRKQVAVIEYKNGKIDGTVELINSSGSRFFKGTTVNGYLNGKCQIIDPNGEDVGFTLFTFGELNNIYLKSQLAPGFWEELTDGRRVTLCSLDEEGRYNGVIYNYSGDALVSVDIFDHGTHIDTKQRFKGDTMEEIEREKVVYIGSYKFGIPGGCLRDGEGVEYDQNGNRVYSGQYKDGKRCGRGILFYSIWPRYEGEWSNNFPNGVGDLKDSSDRLIAHGTWRYGILHTKDGKWIDVVDELRAIISPEDAFRRVQVRYEGAERKGPMPPETLVPEYTTKAWPFSWFVSYTVKNNSGLTSLNMQGLWFHLFSAKISTLTIASGIGHDITNLNLNHCHLLSLLIIGDNCFPNVKNFSIANLYDLKEIQIGVNSFTKHINSWSNNSSRSFLLKNCPSLQKVQIGMVSFSDYAGSFEIKDCPSLVSIELAGYNFCLAE